MRFTLLAAQLAVLATTCLLGCNAASEPAGAARKPRVVATTGMVADMVRSIAGKKHVCIEEGTHAEWVYELLEPLVDEIVVYMAPVVLGHEIAGVVAVAARGSRRDRVSFLEPT